MLKLTEIFKWLKFLAIRMISILITCKNNFSPLCWFDSTSPSCMVLIIPFDIRDSVNMYEVIDWVTSMLQSCMYIYSHWIDTLLDLLCSLFYIYHSSLLCLLLLKCELIIAKMIVLIVGIIQLTISVVSSLTSETKVWVLCVYILSATSLVSLFKLIPSYSWHK